MVALPYEETLVVVYGRKGQGKSTFMRGSVIEHADEGHARFLVLDSTREWTDRGRYVRRLSSTEFDLEQAARLALLSAPCVLVVDEVDRWVPNHAGALKAGTASHAIVHYGRHYRVGLFCAFRRPTGVHKDVIALADAHVLFNQTHPADLARVEELGGVALAREVERLVPFDHVVWRPGVDDGATVPREGSES